MRLFNIFATDTHVIISIFKIKFSFKIRKRETMHPSFHYLQPVYNCKIGKNSYIGEGTIIPSHNTEIGSFTSIASFCCIGLTIHPTNWLSTHPFQYLNSKKFSFNLEEKELKKFNTMLPVIVSNDVWIGSYAKNKDGVKIGDGAIIGAGAVVTKDVPPYAIVGGVPARIIKYRFDEKTIQELLSLKWWELDEEKIKYLPFDNVQECIKK